MKKNDLDFSQIDDFIIHKKILKNVVSRFYSTSRYQNYISLCRVYFSALLCVAFVCPILRS